MKNRITVRHGMLPDLETYLRQSGWKLEPTVGTYEVLRARRGLDPDHATEDEWHSYWNSGR